MDWDHETGLRLWMWIGAAEGQHPSFLVEHYAPTSATSAVQGDPALCRSIPKFASFDCTAHRPNRPAVHRVDRSIIQRRYAEIGEWEAGLHAEEPDAGRFAHQVCRRRLSGRGDAGGYNDTQIVTRKPPAVYLALQSFGKLSREEARPVGRTGWKLSSSQRNHLRDLLGFEDEKYAGTFLALPVTGTVPRSLVRRRSQDAPCGRNDDASRRPSSSDGLTGMCSSRRYQ